MRLFTEDTSSVRTTSLEQYVDYFNNTDIIATEALSDYLLKIKDKFLTTYNYITSQTNDKIVLDVMSSRFEIESRVKRINFTNIRDSITSKPENFNGKFVDYTLALINSSDVMLTETEKTLSNLKMAIGSFINNYDANKVETLYGGHLFKKSEKLLEIHRKTISKFFPTDNGNTKVKFKDILKSLKDIEPLFKDIEVLDKTVNLSRINYIGKMAKDASELVDIIIEQNSQGNIVLKNDEYKKELVNFIHISAKMVEFSSFLYANVTSFYGVFSNVTNDLKKLSDL